MPKTASATRYHPMLDSLPGLGRDPADVRRRVVMLERVLERLWVVPGINRPVGLDVLLDVIPFGGTMIGAALGAYMVWEARNLGMSRWATMRMLGNVGIDATLGAIPWIGAIPDFFFRSNTRNLRIIKAHLDRYHPATAVIEP